MSSLRKEMSDSNGGGGGADDVFDDSSDGGLGFESSGLDSDEPHTSRQLTQIHYGYLRTWPLCSTAHL